MKKIPQLTCLALMATAALAPAADAPVLRGYSPESARAEHDWEVMFRAIPAPRTCTTTCSASPRARTTSARRTTRTTPNGSWRNSRSGAWTRISRRSTCSSRRLKTRTGRTGRARAFHGQAAEPTVAGDPTSGQHDEQLPTYNAYSIDGDVTAPLVYVNYGVPDDYEQLDRLGVSVKGAIVIARYGGSWRGIKPKVAAEHGAIGCIIYSDPREDGYFAGEVFPQGPYRPRDGVQRGSVMDMPIYPGDPLTPGVGATTGRETAGSSKMRRR